MPNRNRVTAARGQRHLIIDDCRPKTVHFTVSLDESQRNIFSTKSIALQSPLLPLHKNLGTSFRKKFQSIVAFAASISSSIAIFELNTKRCDEYPEGSLSLVPRQSTATGPTVVFRFGLESQGILWKTMGPEQAWVQHRMGAVKDIIDKGNGAIPRKAEQGFIVSKPSSTRYRCELNSRPSNGARPRRLPGRPVGLGALFQQESRAS
ncbi:hypothetical protein C8J56DRAFT_1090189 [Mycena floridula]|nr:hypothetical protein C8J56DRAFT_1090189 [Mycena floridula]